MYLKCCVHKAWWVAIRKWALCIKEILLLLGNTDSMNHKYFYCFTCVQLSVSAMRYLCKKPTLCLYGS